jgi:hypothetical protein
MALWFEQDSEPSVWHVVVGDAGLAQYQMACGWESDLELRDIRRLRPVRPGEPGPSLDERCVACTEAVRNGGQAELPNDGHLTSEGLTS